MLPSIITLLHFLRATTALLLLSLRNIVYGIIGCFCCCNYNEKKASMAQRKKNDDIQQQDDEEETTDTVRVCVIGGGIAGMSTAYGLSRIHTDKQNENGKNNKKIEITVLEPRQTLGGNAKTHDWTSAGYPNLRTGLSVLAWPAALFHNYEHLLRQLRQEVEVVTPTFMVSRDGKEMHWVHTPKDSDLSHSVNKWAAADMKKWDNAVEVARKINHVSALIGITFYALSITLPLSIFYRLTALILFTVFGHKNNWAARKIRRDASDKNVFDRLHDTKKSLYTFSILNPLNIISLEFWMCRCFGVSQRFWDTVVVPVYSSSFLTTAFHELPATIVVALDDIISVGGADPCKPLHTWRQSSKDVFDALSKEILAANPNNNRVQTGAVVEHVIPYQYEKRNSKAGQEAEKNLVKWTQYDAAKNESNQFEEYFDTVVFACPGPEVRKMIHCSSSTKHAAHRPGLLGTLLDEIVGGITYEDTRDDNYVTGYIHDDAEVVPHSPSSYSSGSQGSTTQPDLHTTFFSRNFSNYVRIFDETTTQMCNVFSLGTWVPAALRHEADVAINQRNETPKGYLPLFVSYDGPRNALNRQRPGASPLPASCPPVDDPRLCHPGPDASRIRGEVDNSLAHPRLNLANLARMWSLRFLQGESGLYFAGNYTTPGNGHDLSLLSGMSVASKIGRNIFNNNNNNDNDDGNEEGSCSSTSTPVHHPILKFLGSRLISYETEAVKRAELNGNVYASSVSAQSDFELLRGMMGLN